MPGTDDADHVREVPAEVRLQRDQLEATVADLRARLDGAEQAQAELRRLLALALQRPALPAPSEPKLASDADLPPWWSWRRWAWWR